MRQQTDSLSVAGCGFRELFDDEWLVVQILGLGSSARMFRVFITFSQQKDFIGAINDLLSSSNGNKQIDDLL